MCLELTRDQKRAPDPWNRIYGCLWATRCMLGTTFRACQVLLSLLWSPLVIIIKQSQILISPAAFFYTSNFTIIHISHNHSQDHIPLHKKNNPCEINEQLIQTVQQTVYSSGYFNLMLTIQFSYIFNDFRKNQYFIRKWILCGKILPNSDNAG